MSAVSSMPAALRPQGSSRSRYAGALGRLRVGLRHPHDELLTAGADDAVLAAQRA
jgi:hypothetical protein